MIDTTNSCLKRLEKLPPKQYKQVAKAVFGLSINPFPHDSIQLGKSGRRRQDVGEYRIVYRMEGDVVVVLVIGKRNDGEVYRNNLRKN